MEVLCNEHLGIVADHQRLMATIQLANGFTPEDRLMIERAVVNATKGRMRSAATRQLERQILAQGSDYHTEAACRAGADAPSPEYDHAVPISMIHNLLLEVPMLNYGNPPPVGNAQQLLAVLQTYVKIVRVTPTEHRSLSGSTMPRGWTWGAGAVLDRYLRRPRNQVALQTYAADDCERHP